MKVLAYLAGFYIVILLHVFPVCGQVARATFTVKIPPDTSVAKGVYLAGSFNYWHAGDSLYRMKKVDADRYTITIPVFNGMKYYYKYTLGSWQKVEVQANDSNTANREFAAKKKTRLFDTVASWRHPAPPTDSSAQLKRIVAMKDSLVAKIVPALQDVQGLLKSYILNILNEIPDRGQQEKLDAQGVQMIGNVYKQITGFFWKAGNSLSKEQKQRISAAIAKAPSSDFINSFFNALGSAVN